LWDPGDELGVVRRTLDFSGDRTLLKARSVELRVEGLGEEHCEANLTADLSNQRGEYISLAGILGATLAALFMLAGMQNPLFLLGVLPMLAAPALGFRFAYSRACLELRRALDELLDAAEEGQPHEEPQDRDDRPRGQIKGLEPIPRFSPDKSKRVEP
jgi:Flp pilus assembly protein TadB